MASCKNCLRLLPPLTRGFLLAKEECWRLRARHRLWAFPTALSTFPGGPCPAVSSRKRLRVAPIPLFFFCQTLFIWCASVFPTNFGNKNVVTSRREMGSGHKASPHWSLFLAYCFWEQPILNKERRAVRGCSTYWVTLPNKYQLIQSLSQVPLARWLQ